MWARTGIHVDPRVIDLAGLIHDVDAAHVRRQLQEVLEHDDLHQLAQRRRQPGHCDAEKAQEWCRDRARCVRSGAAAARGDASTGSETEQGSGTITPAPRLHPLQ